MTDTKKKPSKALTDEQLKVKADIEKLAHRLIRVCREVEGESLDMAMYSDAYARGGFPKTHLVQITNRLDGYCREVERVLNKWTEVMNVQQSN